MFAHVSRPAVVFSRLEVWQKELIPRKLVTHTQNKTLFEDMYTSTRGSAIAGSASDKRNLPEKVTFPVPYTEPVYNFSAPRAAHREFKWAVLLF